GAGEKLELQELLQPLRPKPALRAVAKEISRVQQKKPVELPLSKEEAKRVVREAAYDGTSKEVGKWQEVVLQHRRAEQMVFPLKQEIPTVVPLERATSAWKPRTPLEQEIFGLLHKTQQPIRDPLLTPEETASLQAMSLEEARQRRAELQKARALQSYYEAKARRVKKIKSKKYHRVLKKSRRRQALQEFERLHRADPAAALAQLEELEQLRMQERMSLKHQNKGKWARSRAIVAKYDMEARKALQEQLARNKELMQKVQLELPKEEDDEVPKEEEPVSVTVPAVSTDASGANPWMLGQPSHPYTEPRAQEPSEAMTVPAAAQSQEEEEEEEMSEEEALLQDFEQRRQARQAGSPEGQGELLWGQAKGRGWWSCHFSCSIPAPVFPHPLPLSPGAAEVVAAPAGTCATELGSLSPDKDQPQLQEELHRAQSLEEVEALASEEHVEELEKPPALRATKRAPQQEKDRAGDKGEKKTPAKKKKMISLEAVLAKKAPQAPCPSLPLVIEEEEGGVDQRGVIMEAFAGDDVVADFRREKRRVEEAGKPQPINLVLPGWGEWGGSGLKPSAKKVKRFLIKPPPAPPRKDKHLPHVIISEKRNIHAAAHQVSELPFPFEKHQQFEQSIRAPLGTTWNTQRSFQKLTAPRVITRQGHIIQPLSAEDVPEGVAVAGARSVPEREPKRLQHSRRPPRRRLP
ncbi:UT14A protein, partial [Turnix velox]|nr:UT14A protein [Turnix velox]